MNSKTKMGYTSEKGITLIALVITIIVLLILAGVTISMVLGDDGIIAQAQEAKNVHEEATTEELLNLAAVDARLKGEDYTTIESVEHLKDALESVGLRKNAEEITEGYKVEIGDKVYKITSSGTVSEKSIVTDITATNYGDYITGYMDLTDIEGTDTDWQVFYNDGKNVWIIASEAVQVENGTAGLTTSGTYAWWTSVPDYGESFDSTNCAKALQTTTNWENYVDDTLAVKAMGGPTAEMFIESYNEKFSKVLNKKIEYRLYETNSTIGYTMNWSDEADASSAQFFFNDDLRDYNNMYFSNNVYMLSSPAAYETFFVMSINPSYGMIYYFPCTEPNYAHIRPVVCLNSNLQVTSTEINGVTTWTIVE